MPKKAARKNINISLIGDKRLQKKLNKLQTITQKQIVRDAALHAMKPVEQIARANAPVLTGNLKKSIKAGSYSARGGKFGASVRTGTRRQLKIEPKEPYYYPAALEYGTRKVPAKSFMRAALFAKKSEVIRRFRSRLKKILL